MGYHVSKKRMLGAKIAIFGLHNHYLAWNVHIFHHWNHFLFEMGLPSRPFALFFFIQSLNRFCFVAVLKDWWVCREEASINVLKSPECASTLEVHDKKQAKWRNKWPQMASSKHKVQVLVDNSPQSMCYSAQWKCFQAFIGKQCLYDILIFKNFTLCSVLVCRILCQSVQMTVSIPPVSLTLVYYRL